MQSNTETNKLTAWKVNPYYQFKTTMYYIKCSHTKYK